MESGEKGEFSAVPLHRPLKIRWGEQIASVIPVMVVRDFIVGVRK